MTPHSAKNSLPAAAAQAPTFLPPQALDLEAAVLGAALQDKSAAALVLERLTEPSFYLDAHRLLYAAIRDVSAERQAVDILTVTHRLKAKGVFERAGGAAYLGEMFAKVTPSLNLDEHCAIVREQHIRRVVLEATSELQRKVYDQLLDPFDLAGDASAAIAKVVTDYEHHADGSIADHFDGVFEKMARDVENPGLTGIPTGLLDLNDATGGWQPGDLIIIAARPSMGKTAKMLHAMRAACLDHEHHAAIFSLEMPAQQLVQRLVAAEVEGYSVSQLRRAALDGGVDEVQAIKGKAHRLRTHGHRVMVADGSTLTIQQLRAKCLRWHQEHPLGLVMVDYIQLMEGPQKSKGANREQEIAAISRGLKKLAKELNVPVIALSQLSREVEKRSDKRPQLSDLRESGAIEQDADVIMFLWRPEYYKIDEYEDGSPTAGTMLLDIKKNRNGKLGEVHVGCNLDRGLLFDLEDKSAFEGMAVGQVGPTKIGGTLPASTEHRPEDDDNDLPF
jgi:replicative DNA helicase